MNILKYLGGYARLFRRPTLAEIIAQELKVFEQTKADCETVIESHEFQKHMAEANIRAMKKWTEQHQYAVDIQAMLDKVTQNKGV